MTDLSKKMNEKIERTFMKTKKKKGQSAILGLISKRCLCVEICHMLNMSKYESSIQEIEREN